VSTINYGNSDGTIVTENEPLRLGHILSRQVQGKKKDSSNLSDNNSDDIIRIR